MWAPPSKHCPTWEVVLLQWVTGCAPLEKQLSRQWWTAHGTHNLATASSPVCEQPQWSHLGRISLLLDDACFIHGWLNLTVDKYGTETNKTSAFIILSGLAIVPVVGYGLRLWCYHHKSSYLLYCGELEHSEKVTSGKRKEYTFVHCLPRYLDTMSAPTAEVQGFWSILYPRGGRWDEQIMLSSLLQESIWSAFQAKEQQWYISSVPAQQRKGCVWPVPWEMQRSHLLCYLW